MDKFKKDIFFNFGSLIFLALGGIILNIIIARYYGASVLGFFNKIYAVYMFTSQIAVGSVHLSLQKYLAQENEKEHNRIISAGLGATLVFAVVAISLIFLSRDLWAHFLKDEAIGQSIVYILPGLLAFAFNKSFLAIFNGLRQMKVFAFFQALRYLLLVFFAILAVIFSLKAKYLPFIFTLTEILLLVVMVIYAIGFYKILLVAKWGKWLKIHFSFSYKSFLGHILTDINSRVGVLVLSYFASSREVGIYSLAAVSVEGLSQLLVVLKLNINPILAKLSAHKNRRKIEEIIRRGIRLTYRFAIIFGVLAIMFYPIVIKIFLNQEGFISSWPVFALMAGAVIASGGYQPFQMLLVQLGKPSLYTLLVGVVFIINFTLSVILVPYWGMIGVAIAAAVATVFSVLILKFFSRRYLSLKI